MKKPFKKLINHNEATYSRKMIINQVTGMRSNLQTHPTQIKSEFVKTKNSKLFLKSTTETKMKSKKLV